MIALAVEILRRPGAIRERERIVEDEIQIVIEIDRDRRIGRARQPYRLEPRIVENLILAVERDREQSLGAPFEAAGLAVRQPYGGRAVADQDIEKGLVEMPQRTRLAPRRDLDHVIGHEVAGAVSVGKAAARVVAIPGGRLQRDQVVAEIEMDGDAFAARPLPVGIEEKFLAFRCRRIWLAVRGHAGGPSVPEVVSGAMTIFARPRIGRAGGLSTDQTGLDRVPANTAMPHREP